MWSRTAVAVATLVLFAQAIPPARADFTVQTPYVDYRELELEHKGSVTFDRDSDESNNQKYIGEIGYGLLPWWSIAVETEFEREEGPGNDIRFESYGLENLFQFTERGQYWADLGFFAEIEHKPRKTAADEIAFGPIVSKEIGPTLNTLNFFIEKEIGAGSSGEFELNYRWQTRLLVNPYAEPGFEIHGEPGPINHFESFQDQEHRAGPVIYGTIPFQGAGKLQYEIGYLFGLTKGTPSGTLKWRLEYELVF